MGCDGARQMSSSQRDIASGRVCTHAHASTYRPMCPSGQQQRKKKGGGDRAGTHIHVSIHVSLWSTTTTTKKRGGGGMEIVHARIHVLTHPSHWSTTRKKEGDACGLLVNNKGKRRGENRTLNSPQARASSRMLRRVTPGGGQTGRQTGGEGRRRRGGEKAGVLLSFFLLHQPRNKENSCFPHTHHNTITPTKQPHRTHHHRSPLHKKRTDRQPTTPTTRPDRTRQDVPPVQRGRHQLLLPLLVDPVEEEVHRPHLGHRVVLPQPQHLVRGGWFLGGGD